MVVDEEEGYDGDLDDDDDDDDDDEIDDDDDGGEVFMDVDISINSTDSCEFIYINLDFTLNLGVEFYR